MSIEKSSTKSNEGLEIGADDRTKQNHAHFSAVSGFYTPLLPPVFDTSSFTFKVAE